MKQRATTTELTEALLRGEAWAKRELTYRRDCSELQATIRLRFKGCDINHAYIVDANYPLLVQAPFIWSE